MWAMTAHLRESPGRGKLKVLESELSPLRRGRRMGKPAQWLSERCMLVADEEAAVAGRPRVAHIRLRPSGR